MVTTSCRTGQLSEPCSTNKNEKM